MCLNRITLLCLGTLLTVSSASAFQLTSPVMKNGGTIPTVFTCHGANQSPPLAWQQTPAGTEAFALIVRDPDATSKNWIHWSLYNIPFGTVSLPQNYDAKVAGVLVGRNSWGKTAYEGPCPPQGKIHHYRFELYALDQALYTDPALDVSQLQTAMQGHILGMSSLVVTFSQSSNHG